MAEELVPMKPQVYKDPRPAEHFTRFHERVRRGPPDPMYEAVRMVLSPLVWTLWRGRSIGAENVPASGPVILAPNHFSFMDHFFLAAFIRRKVQFMAKSQLFVRPFQFVYTHGGVFPVRRGQKDEEAFITAETILGRGGTIAMYCEGGRSRTGKLAEKAKPGIGRLALETGALVVPVAIYGSQRTRNWKRLQFPKVTVQYGEPMAFETVADSTRERQQAVADEVLAAIKEVYGGLEEHGRRGIVQRIRAQRRAERRARRTATA
ncbi:MAG TPA: lysophospholipid acyltransferase family protein [Solirubrobacteraceae bacterium]|nr:lysophospholipid acyltransferase family protein [Solirubrobacteraceae bacterium]